MKWVEISEKPSKEHFEFLSQYLNEKKISNEVSFLEATRENFWPICEKAKEQFDQIRIGPPFGEQLLSTGNQSPASLLVLKAGDCLVKDANQTWWPNSLLYEIFLAEFTSEIKTLDLNSAVMVVGCGASARIVVGALVRLGFIKFNITDRFQERALKFIDELKKSYFNVQFQFVSQSEIMLLPGSNAFLVNATPLVPSNDLLFDLYYFNFLKSPGVVIDLTLIPVKTPLLQEAENIGARIISGYEIAARMDILWIKKCFNVDLSLEEYSEKLKTHIEKVPYDLTPFANSN